MDNFSPKDLKSLADACRKAGIKSFKGYGLEFTLNDEAPSKRTRTSRKAATPAAQEQDTIESDAPSDDDILMWSAGGGIPMNFDGN